MQLLAYKKKKRKGEGIHHVDIHSVRYETCTGTIVWAWNLW